ncbi:hypothetical protein F2Q69_00007123 [Brassica cretica]|uniref:Uncharacterized protein n=1 Tax=Brassica cretica TaxID=69181 RepID=A0A8S9NTZ3_BRACR|nr:hypothetical protein F2Q69_00007123 [Brassica cretica]
MEENVISIGSFFIPHREDMKLCLSSLSLQFYAFKSNFDFTFSEPNQAMLLYEIERVVCVCKSRAARDEEDDGEAIKGRVDPGNQYVLVMISSSLRSLELLRGLYSLTQHRPALKLFAKHLTIKKHVVLYSYEALEKGNQCNAYS